MTNEFNKKMHVATCKHCGKVTNIDECKAVQDMIVRNKTLKEQVSETENKTLILRANKNGIIQHLHLTIKRLLDLMTDEQRVEAKKIYQKKFFQ